MIVRMPGDPTARIEVQDVPAVRSARCGIGTGKPMSMIVNSGSGSGSGAKRMIVICTDRIAKASADGVIASGGAGNVEHDAYTRALTGLVDARAKVVADPGMADADRARALTGIDQAIVEMKGQLARGR